VARFPRLMPFRAVLVITGIAFTLPAGADEVRVGRYSALSAVPTEAQRDLLAGIVTVAFPEPVATVGDAVRHLLQGTGYRLAGDVAAHPARSQLLRLPLPDAHRHLGPMPVRLALETLAGPAFQLVEDPVHRLVSYELCEPRIGRSVGATAENP